jgi:SNF2 family DNA or RNA helicase
MTIQLQQGNIFQEYIDRVYLDQINILGLPEYKFRYTRNIQLFHYQTAWVNAAFSALDLPVYNEHGEESKIQGFCNWDDCGMGKTYMTLELALKIWEDKSNEKANNPVLIICPKNSKKQWAQAIREYLADRIRITRINDSSMYDMDEDRKFFIIMHFEQMRGEIEEMVSNDDRFAAVIIDESHRIRNRGTKVYDAVKRIPTYYYILATATPWHRNPAEVWTSMHLCAPKIFPSYMKFEREHTLWRGQSAIGVKNHRRFAEAISPFTMKRTKREMGIKPPLTNNITIDLNSDQREAYNKIKAGAQIIQSEEMDSFVVKNYLSEIIRRQQVTSHPPIIGFKETSSAKIDWLTEFFEDHSDEEEVEYDDNGNIISQHQYLIFFRFKHTCADVVELLRAKGERVGHLASGVQKDDFNPEDDASIFSDTNTNNVIDQFKSGKVRILCSVIESGGTSLDFRKIPHVSAMFFDLHWSTIKMSQARDRIHGTVTPETRNIYYLIAEGTVDQLIHESILKNWSEQKLAEEFLKRFNEY